MRVALSRDAYCFDPIVDRSKDNDSTSAASFPFFGQVYQNLALFVDTGAAFVPYADKFPLMT